MSDRNRISTIETFNKLKGQFVIADTLPEKTVQRFIGIGEDDMDYLYIFYNGRKLTYTTILSPIVPLKGYVPDEDYNHWEWLWDLNSYDKPHEKDFPYKIDGVMQLISEETYNKHLDEYREELKREILSKNTTLLADLCWR